MTRILRPVLRFFLQAAFCFFAMFFTAPLGNLKISYSSMPGMVTFYSFLLLFIALFTFREHKPSERGKRWPVLFWAVLLIIFFPLILVKMTLGTNDLEPIIIFFMDNELNEVAKVGTESFLGRTQAVLVIYIFLLIAAFYLNSLLYNFHRVILGLIAINLLLNPITLFAYRQLAPNPLHEEFNVQSEVGDIQILTKPTSNKNLILVYVESVERTYKDLESTIIAYEPFSRLALKSFEATNMAQSYGSAFTIAGLVATQCGVPLVPKGLNNAFYARRESEIQVNNFMPSIKCLGDQLRDDGYTLSYMNGAPLEKYSKRGFLSTHGFSRFFDENSLSISEREGFTNLWGLNDEIIFEHAKKEFDELISLKRPFVLSMLTISTHGPDAFLDTDCQHTQRAESAIPDAIRCTGELVTDLYNYIDNKGHSDNTVFVVLSDHLARPNTLEKELKIIGRDRRNMFFIKNGLNSGTNNKLSLPFDIYPTLLETLGYEIDGRRANLGVSLYSNEQSLVERYGDAKQVSELFRGNHVLSEYLWRGSDGVD